MKEALKLALEALENAIAVRHGKDGTKFVDPLESNAITAIKEALAQPEQELVEDVVAYHSDGTRTVRIALKRPWVGLTDEEIQVSWDGAMDGAVFTRRNVYNAIEAKLKEKNT